MSLEQTGVANGYQHLVVIRDRIRNGWAVILPLYLLACISFAWRYNLLKSTWLFIFVIAAAVGVWLWLMWRLTDLLPGNDAPSDGAELEKRLQIIEKKLLSFDELSSSFSNLLIILGLSFTALFLVLHIDDIRKAGGERAFLELAPQAFICTGYALGSVLVLAMLSKLSLEWFEKIVRQLRDALPATEASLLKDNGQELAQILESLFGKLIDSLQTLTSDAHQAELLQNASAKLGDTLLAIQESMLGQNTQLQGIRTAMVEGTEKTNEMMQTQTLQIQGAAQSLTEAAQQMQQQTKSTQELLASFRNFTDEFAVMVTEQWKKMLPDLLEQMQQQIADVMSGVRTGIGALTQAADQLLAKIEIIFARYEGILQSLEKRQLEMVSKGFEAWKLELQATAKKVVDGAVVSSDQNLRDLTTELIKIWERKLNETARTLQAEWRVELEATVNTMRGLGQNVGSFRTEVGLASTALKNAAEEWPAHIDQLSQGVTGARQRTTEALQNIETSINGFMNQETYLCNELQTLEDAFGVLLEQLGRYRGSLDELRRDQEMLNDVIGLVSKLSVDS